MDSDVMSFGRWLSDQLVARDWQPADLARRLHVNTGTVSNWLNDKRVPDATSCARIAEALGMRPELILYRAGRLPELPQPLDLYELQRGIQELRQMEATRQEYILRLEEVVEDRATVRVRDYGRIPADTDRWVAVDEEGIVRRVPVLSHWIGARSPEEFFSFVASGDCLRELGILSGYRVLAQWLRDREPRNGEITMVRLRGGHTMKLWYREGDWVELRDGSGAVTHRISILDDIQPLGVYVTHWRDPQTG